MSKEKTGKPGKKKRLIIAAVVILILAAAALMLLGGSGKTKKDTTANVTTEAAFTGSIAVTTEGSGYVEAASTKALALEYDGKLEKIYVETGDQVTAGETLAVYDTDALDTVIEQKETELEEINGTIAATDDSGSTTITAPVSGRVKRIYASADDMVSSVVENNGGLAEISADGRLKVEFTCTDTALTEGDSVTVEFDSYSVEGTVAEVDGEQVCVTIQDDTE